MNVPRGSPRASIRAFDTHRAPAHAACRGPGAVEHPGLAGGCSGMTPTPEFLPILTIDEKWRADPLRLAVAGYLARYRGETRRHAESDLRAYLTLCQERGLDPLAARRPHVELYVRWMQETRRYAASTVSRRMSIVGGFYRTCVIDEILEHSPA